MTVWLQETVLRLYLNILRLEMECASHRWGVKGAEHAISYTLPLPLTSPAPFFQHILTPHWAQVKSFFLNESYKLTKLAAPFNTVRIHCTNFYYTINCNIFIFFNFQKQTEFLPWLVRLSGMSARLWTKRFPVQVPVRAHAWVAGQVPRGGHIRGGC